MAEKEFTQVDIAVLANDMKYVKDTVQKISHKLDSQYVTKDQLELVKSRLQLIQNVVFGMIGIILVTVLTAILTGVLK